MAGFNRTTLQYIGKTQCLHGDLCNQGSWATSPATPLWLEILPARGLRAPMSAMQQTRSQRILDGRVLLPPCPITSLASCLNQHEGVTALLPCWSLHARKQLDCIPLHKNMSASGRHPSRAQHAELTLSTILNSNIALSHPSQCPCDKHIKKHASRRMSHWPLLTAKGLAMHQPLRGSRSAHNYPCQHAAFLSLH